MSVTIHSRLRDLVDGIRGGQILRLRPVKFLAIGVVNTAFGYSIFALSYLATSDHRLSIALATIIGVIFNFFTTGRIVFQSTSNALILRFIGGYVISLGANLILLEILVRLGMNALLAQVICLPPIVVITYFVNARLVFRNTARPLT